MFLNDTVALPKIVVLPTLFRKMTFFVYLSHEISHRDAIWFLAEVSFRVRYGAPQVSSLRKFRVNLYRGTPLGKEHAHALAD